MKYHLSRLRDATLAFVLAAVTFPAMGAPTGAVPYSLFGATLDGDLSIQRCSTPPIEAHMCATAAQGFATSGWDVITVHFQTDDPPDIMSGGQFSALIMGGRVQEITIPTSGLKVQEKAFATLSAKFGTPTSIFPTELQNGFGAKFKVINATWENGTGEVTLVGVLDNVNSGAIVASTAAARALRAQMKARKTEGEPKL